MAGVKRCGQPTKRGGKCKRARAPGSLYCHLHQPGPKGRVVQGKVDATVNLSGFAKRLKESMGGQEQPPQDQYKVEEVVAAVEGSRGIVAAVAKRLGCSRTTVYSYVKRYPEVRQALDDARNTLLDLAEGVLFTKAINERDNTALIFLLKTLGKERGYVERGETALTDPEGNAVPPSVRVVFVDPPKHED